MVVGDLTRVPYDVLRRILALEEHASAQPTLYVAAAELVRTHLLDVPRYATLLARAAQAGVVVPPDDAWMEAARAAAGAELQRLRAATMRAFTAQDTPAIAAQSLRQGHVLALAGDYKQAALVYRQASADASMDGAANYYVAQLDIAQSKWSYVTTQLRRQAAALGGGGPFAVEAAADLALAAWAAADYGVCARCLLHAPAAGHDDALFRWLAPDAMGALLAVSAGLALERAQLEFVVRTDPVFARFADAWPALRALLTAYLALDVAPFWAHARELRERLVGEWCVAATLAPALAQLGTALHANYLAVHRRLPLAPTAELFAASGERADPAYFARLAARMDVPLALDTVAGTIRIGARAPATAGAAAVRAAQELVERRVTERLGKPAQTTAGGAF